tara:strand:- start:2552 stop:4582 length:2031 start_codon:yes stop_codon:yes gene_type:complete
MAGDTIKFLIEMRDGASAPLKKVGKAADQSGKSAQGASTRYTELSSKLHLMGIAAKAAMGAVNGVLKPMRALAMGGIEAGAQMEGFETRLTVLMGSSEDARERLERLFEIGSTTPFELPGLMEAEVNLRALGVNAEEVLPLVMDFAGAMKTDLASAAVEVGRAMQFGAGAVETISGRALRAQVELATGADALKMSTEEFRAAMVATLTDEDGIFKGGTDKLAKTFDGMLSNLQDSFFKFKKEVGEADLFLTAKATLSVVLDMLEENKKAVSSLAQTFGKHLAKSMLFVIELMFKIAATFTKAQQGGEIFKQIWLAIKIALNEASRAMQEFMDFIPGIDMSEAVAKTTALIAKQNLELAKTADIVDDLKDKRLNIELEGKKTVERIEATAIAMAQRPKDSKKGGPIPPQQQQQDGIPAKDKEVKIQQVDFTGELEVDLFKKGQALRLAKAITDGLADPFSAMTNMMGPAGGLLQGLSAIGQMGTEQIVESFKASIGGVIKAIFEVIPQLIVELPQAIVEGFLVGLVDALRKLFAFLIENMFRPNKEKRKARRDEFRENLEDSGISKFEQSLLMLITGPKAKDKVNKRLEKMHTGTSFVDRTGAFLLQAGEAVIPNSGTTTQGMAKRMSGGGGMNVTINTNVVDQNSIRGLGRLLENEFSSFGRSTSPLFNSPTGAGG